MHPPAEDDTGSDDGGEHLPDDHDRTGEHLQHTDTRWSLELDNPYLWLDVAPL
jgi:hypothetical protein